MVMSSKSTLPFQAEHLMCQMHALVTVAGLRFQCWLLACLMSVRHGCVSCAPWSTGPSPCSVRPAALFATVLCTATVEA
jgi:hypothetical protein